MPRKRSRRVERWKLLFTHPIQWYKTRKASVWTRKEVLAANTQYFFDVSESDRPALLTTADWDLANRQKTANISYLVGGVLASACADLLANHWGAVPKYITASYALGLILLLTAIFPAFTELIRWAPTVAQQTEDAQAKQGEPRAAPEMQHSLTARLEAGRYAQTQQRIFHLQRNMYRFRCFTAVAMVVVSRALLQLMSL